MSAPELSPEEQRIVARFDAAETLPEAYQPTPLVALLDQLDELRAQLDDERGARRVAGAAADRFRDVLSDALDFRDENPGDDTLVAALRSHFGRTGPEPTRWRDFCAGALAVVDQLNADVTP